MVVLKKTKSDWRLFWVVELVGMSFTLALAGWSQVGRGSTGNNYAQTSTSIQFPPPASNEQSNNSDPSLNSRSHFWMEIPPLSRPCCSDLLVGGSESNSTARTERASIVSFKTIIRAMKPLCTAYTGLIAALVLLEIGPFLAAITIASSNLTISWAAAPSM